MNQHLINHALNVHALALDQAARYARQHGRVASLPPCTISFDLYGHTGGYYEKRAGKHHIRINVDLLEREPWDTIQNTIPHEMAHFIQQILHGSNVLSHGIEWQQIMIDCYGAMPDKTLRPEIQTRSAHAAKTAARAKKLIDYTIDI